MLATDAGMVHGGLPDTSYAQPLSSRRMRPTELTRPELRTPLRQEKSNRRESRLGLRNLFSRSRSAVREPERPVSPTHNVAFERRWPAHRPVTNHGHSTTETREYQPLEQHNNPSYQRPLSFLAESPMPPTQQNAQPEQANDRSSTMTRSPKGSREENLSWQLPPLFKAYPQAIRNATLPAPTLTADAILRLNEIKGGFPYNADPPSSAEALQDATKDGEKEKARKLQRHISTVSAPRFEWTNRIYILSTSGCLLEYGATGPFDRLPERVVRLSKTSAAFVSDAIPGRHYVLQVSSGVEHDTAQPVADSRSILSKLVTRSADRRNASNILMTFDNAEDMNGWMISLRREIEKLGGRRTLSETGEPREAELYQLEDDSVQRPFVLPDPQRFSRILPEFEWQMGRNSQSSDVPPVMTRDPSLDDGSTNSIISHDGRQLDSLRENNNRLSFISSGQRTMVSSGSSPMSSPTRDSFSSPCEEPCQNYEIRSRPNAAAILHRRTSLQTLGPFIDSYQKTGNAGPNVAPRAAATPVTPSPVPAKTPNFSVPRSSNRHLTPVRSPPMNQDAAVIPDREANRLMRPRRPPPMSARSTRPLSMVVDQPSPCPEIPERSKMRLAAAGASLADETALHPARPTSSARSPGHGPSASEPPHVLAVHSAPRRMSSMSSIRRPGEVPPRIRTSLMPPRSPEVDQPLPSARSMHRASVHATSPQGVSKFDLPKGFPASFNELPPLRAPPPKTPLPPVPTQPSHSAHSSADSMSKALAYRRSMPQLAMGPPSAPPPMCALPPVPRKPSVYMGGLI